MACCLGNPGKGGFAAVVRRYENGAEIKKRVVSNNAPETTNNKMELMAAIEGLRQIRRNGASNDHRLFGQPICYPRDD